MPYTRKQVKLFLSKASPLSGEQQDNVKSELHANPAMGHARKGSAALKRPTPRGKLSPASAAKIRVKANAMLGGQ